MGAPKPTLGFPSRSAAIIALQSEGLTTRQIADRLGIQPKNVVSLAMSAMGAKKRVTLPAEARGHAIVLPIDVLGRLARHAEARGISTTELVRRLVGVVVDDQLVDAILDDATAEASA